MSYGIQNLVHGGKRINFSNEHFTISSKVMRIITELGPSVDEHSSDDEKEALISSVKSRVGDDKDSLLQLVVYARALLWVHPSNLTHITCGFSREQARPYLKISAEVGKQKQKLDKSLAGAR